MDQPPSTTLPVEPLIRYLERQALRVANENDRFIGPAGLLERLTGCGRHIWYRRMTDGLSIDDADRIATALGQHPTRIWGDDWWRDVMVGGDV